MTCFRTGKRAAPVAGLATNFGSTSARIATAFTSRGGRRRETEPSPQPERRAHV